MLKQFHWQDYTHYILPDSLGMPVNTSKEAYLANLTLTLGMFTAFTVTTKEIVEETGKIAFHATSTGTSATGASYANEYILIVQFREDESGTPKISCVKEFVDSQFSVAFFAAERERIAKAQTPGITS
ncbi:hypothetical protein AURDEDRAFT_169277 [Auricularia subglabra TFB-10046 SS5]|nr:hypothetical protein AURDEDRAFT_169277 [Auricularia subglabra TFB-10046 SS5]